MNSDARNDDSARLGKNRNEHIKLKKLDLQNVIIVCIREVT
jgi:hypothetical protein